MTPPDKLTLWVCPECGWDTNREPETLIHPSGRGTDRAYLCRHESNPHTYYAADHIEDLARAADDAYTGINAVHHPGTDEHDGFWEIAKRGPDDSTPETFIELLEWMAS